MSRAPLTILRRYITCNKNARHIREECSDFPEMIPETETPQEKTKNG